MGNNKKPVQIVSNQRNVVNGEVVAPTMGASDTIVDKAGSAAAIVDNRAVVVVATDDIDSSAVNDSQSGKEPPGLLDENEEQGGQLVDTRPGHMVTFGSSNEGSDRDVQEKVFSR